MAQEVFKLIQFPSGYFGGYASRVVAHSPPLLLQQSTEKLLCIAQFSVHKQRGNIHNYQLYSLELSPHDLIER